MEKGDQLELGSDGRWCGSGVKVWYAGAWFGATRCKRDYAWRKKIETCVLSSRRLKWGSKTQKLNADSK